MLNYIVLEGKINNLREFEDERSKYKFVLEQNKNGDTTNNESSKNFFKVTVYHDIAQKFAPELYEGSYVVLSGFLLDNIVYARHLRQYSLIPEDYAYDWENDGFK